MADRVPLDALVRRILNSPIYEHFVDGCPGLKELAVLYRALDAVDSGDADCVVLDAPATGHGLALLSAPRLVSEAVRGGPFARMAVEVGEALSDSERSAVVAVTLAEEMPVNETLELRDRLERELDLEPELLVVNALYPDVPRGVTADGDALTELWIERRRLNDQQCKRLTDAWPAQQLGLPLLAREAGSGLVDELAERFLVGLGA